MLIRDSKVGCGSSRTFSFKNQLSRNLKIINGIPRRSARLADKKPSCRSLMAEDYPARQAMFGLASLEEVAAAAAKDNVVWLDVRSDGEVAESPLPGGKAVHIPHTAVAARAGELPADKDVPIICFCGVGGRVRAAKAALEGLGYTGVLNAGGLKDLVAAGLA